MSSTPRLPLLSYDVAPHVRAFTTMRHGGVGQGAYACFNVTHYCGDAPATVAANRALLADELGIEPERIVLPRQTHGTRLHFMDSEADVNAAKLEGVDAVATSLRRLCIGVSTADCIPLLFFDPWNDVVAAVHAGWRGTCAGIAVSSLRALTARYGTHPGELRVVIGPGISREAFEVGDEVCEAFRDAAFPMHRIARRIGGKWHIDLPLANILALIDAGVRREAVYSCGVCTFTQWHDYFSARRLGIRSGRLYSGIMLL